MPCLVVFSLAVFMSFAHGQSVNAPAPPKPPGLPKEPAEIFSAAAAFYDLGSANLKPWHMKVSYQLYDEQSKPSEQGTYEYWWAKPGTYRSTWLRPGMEQTDWHDFGIHYYQAKGSPLEFYERKLQSDLLTPLPKDKDFDPESSVMQWEYKPYMLNGQPTEIDTTINVVFNLGN